MQIIRRSVIFIVFALSMTIGLQAQSVPSPWSTEDIGSVGVTGSAGYSNGTFTVAGSGADIWGTADGFRSVHQSITGNGEIIARVASLQNTDGWAKAALMFREDLSAGAKNVALTVTPSNGIRLQWRSSVNGTTTNGTGTGAPPQWVKLVRDGNNFTAYKSADGVTWTFIVTQTVSMAETSYVGLAVTSHNNTVAATAVVDSVTVNSLAVPPSPWATQDVGSVGVPGRASLNNGTFSVTGSGADIWGTADGFRFVYQPLTGDGEIVTRVASLQNNDGWAKAAVMLREDLNAGSKYAALIVTLANGTNFQWRSTVNGATNSVNGSGAAPYWIKISRHGNNFVTHKSADGATWTFVAAQTITMANTLYVGLAVTSHVTTVPNTSTFDNVTVRTLTTPPSPWVTQDIGGPGVSGSATYDDSTFTVTGSGTDIWGTADSFRFVHQPLDGNGELVARIAALQNTDPWAKASVMFREDLTAGSKNVTVNLTPSNGINLQWRSAASGSTSISSNASGTVPYWIKLVRDGNAFSAYRSTDGSAWTLVASQTVSMTSAAYVGLAVTSHNNAVLSTARFTGVSTTNNHPPVVAITGPSAGATYTAPGEVAITVEASDDGAVSKVEFFNGTTKIGESTTAPFSWTWSSVAEGTYSLTAKATDNFGISAISSAKSITVNPNVVIQSLSSSSALAGTPITLTGSSFGATKGTSTVTIGGQTASTNSWSDTEIVAVVPGLATNSGVKVTRSVDSNVVAFTALRPQIAGLSPSMAEVGAQVTLTGSNFGVSGTGATVTLNNQTMSPVSWSDSEIVVPVPLNAVSGNIVVSRGVAVSNGAGFTVEQPAPTNGAVNYVYNDAGQLVSARDSLGNLTTNVYDANGNLLSTTITPGSGGPAVVTSFAYDVKGQVTRVTDAKGNQTNLAYTSAGLVSTSTDAQNNVNSYAYDTRGNRTSVTDAATNVAVFEYDSRNRLTKITNPDLTFITLAYDSRGHRTSVIDANSRTTTNTYDGAGRLISITDPSSNLTSYAYDTENNLISITDAKNHTTSFEYDNQGRVTKTTFPSTLAELYNYDQTGNLVNKVDRNGNTTTYVYDVRNRLARKNYQNDTGVDYTYDIGNRLIQAADASGSYQLSYDSLGRLTGVTTNYSFVPGTYAISFTYDLAGNRLTMTDSQNVVTGYVYDSLNRVNSMTTQGQVFSLAYDALSRRSSLTRPNGVITTYAYNNHSNLTSVLHQHGATVLDGFGYTPGSVGNRTARVNFATGDTDAFSYDPLHQLTEVVRTVSGTSNTTETYSYDQVGNRTSSHNAASYALNSSNQLTSSSSGVSYTYDENGNTLSKTIGTNVTQYQWDFENRLTQVTLPDSSSVTFKYDPFGRRIHKSSSAGATNYLYAGASVIQELNASGTVSARYVQGPGIDEPFGYYDGNVWIYYQQDGLGSVTSLTDAGGALASTYSYDSFGNPSTTVAGQPFRYTGREWDSETGLYYYRARYYDPNAGRFISEDPLRFSAGPNMFAYVRNNAVNSSDPSGLLDLYIWRPSRANDAYGHAAIKLKNGTSISWWPGAPAVPNKPCEKCSGSRKSIKQARGSVQDMFFAAPAVINQTVEDAQDLEGRPADVVLHIEGLDENAIQQWWDNYTRNNKVWDTAKQNCSTVAADALTAGGGLKSMLTPRPFMWTPIDVEVYGRAIQAEQAGIRALIWSMTFSSLY